MLAPDLAQRLERQPYYAGSWIDVQDGDRVKVGVAGRVTAEAAGQIAAAAAAVGLTGAYDVVGVRHPQRALDEASDWLGRELARVNTGARATLVAGQRTDLNTVELQSPIGGELTSGQRELLTQARERLGDRLVVSTYAGNVTTDACTYPYCDQPLRAGIGITNAGRFCTGAFIAKSKDDNKLYQFTAGHCVWGHLSNWTTRSATNVEYVIGPVWTTMWIPVTLTGDTPGDAAIVQIKNAPVNPKPWVYFAFGPFQNPSYHIASDNYSLLGMHICVSGASYGISNCGVVTQLALLSDSWWSPILV